MKNEMGNSGKARLIGRPWMMIVMGLVSAAGIIFAVRRRKKHLA